jgi:branched-chain amino acid transport system permease protein
VRVQRQAASGVVALIIGIGLIVTIASMSLWASQGLIRDVVELCCYIAVAQMWNLLAGYGGMVSVGQQAFVGVAAYMLFVMAQLWGINPFVAVMLAMIAPAILAIPTYGLLHRLDGPYFAIGTWVIAEVMRLATSVFGYVNAGAGMSLRVMTSYPADQRALGVSVLCALMLLLTVGGSYALLRSRYGLALIAIRDNPIAARAMGIDIALYKTLTFGVSALFTGIAGALSAIVVQFVAPDSFTFLLSVALFVGLVVGGVGSIPGALVGGLFVLFVPNLAEQVSKGLAGAVYGIILILVIYVMPSGAAGLARLVINRAMRASPWNARPTGRNS